MSQGLGAAFVVMILIYILGFEFLSHGTWIALRTSLGLERISVETFLWLAGGITATVAWGMYYLTLFLGRPKNRKV